MTSHLRKLAKVWLNQGRWNICQGSPERQTKQEILTELLATTLHKTIISLRTNHRAKAVSVQNLCSNLRVSTTQCVERGGINKSGQIPTDKKIIHLNCLIQRNWDKLSWTRAHGWYLYKKASWARDTIREGIIWILMKRAHVRVMIKSLIQPDSKHSNKLNMTSRKGREFH